MECEESRPSSGVLLSHLGLPGVIFTAFKARGHFFAHRVTLVEFLVVDPGVNFFTYDSTYFSGLDYYKSRSLFCDFTELLLLNDVRL